MANKTIGLKEAISIGIGGMVGGGIFAVLGLAVSLAKGGTPVAFLIAGLLAWITSYSYVKLSLAFPDRGGTVRFINEGFGKTVLSGAVNNVLWISYIIMLGLYASAFGSYAPNLLALTGTTSADSHVYASAIVVIAAGINYYSIWVVGIVESYAVIIKMIILVLFVILGVYGLAGNDHVAQLSLRHWEHPLQLVTAGMVIFVAYEGFELIANAVPDIEDAATNVPKAYHYSVLFVIVLYVAIAIITVGSLPFDEIASAQDYVLAEAAKPMLGEMGFTIITVAALISTFSAINASLYGGSRVNFEIANDGELPHELTSMFWNKPIGLLVTTVITLVVANALPLESISTAGSAGFLLVFAMVNAVGYKLADSIGGSRRIAGTGVLLCSAALGTLLVQQYSANQLGVIVAVSIVGVCFGLEFVYKAGFAGKSKP